MADGLSILVFNVLWSHVKTKDETYVHVVSLLRITFEYTYNVGVGRAAHQSERRTFAKTPPNLPPYTNASPTTTI
jgi:hypothetical protein